MRRVSALVVMLVAPAVVAPAVAELPAADRAAVAASVDAMREGLWNQLDAFGGEDGNAPQDAKMEILGVLQEIREGYFWACLLYTSPSPRD